MKEGMKLREEKKRSRSKESCWEERTAFISTPAETPATMVAPDKRSDVTKKFEF